MKENTIAQLNRAVKQGRKHLFERPKRLSKGRLLSDWAIGLELEYEDVTGGSTRLARDDSPWEVTGDGSLRNMGAEFRFKQGLGGKEALDAIDMFYDIKRKSGKAWAANRRTSVHVHLNMLPLTYGEVQRILAVYGLVEPALYTFVGAEREENIYCIPFYRADKVDVGRIKELDMMAKDEKIDTTDVRAYFRHTFRHNNKYSGLNTQCLASFGTLEFRQAPSLSRPKLLVWLNLLTSIAHYGLEAESTEEIIAQYEELGALLFCRKVFGEYYSNLDIRELNTRTGKKLQAFNDAVDVVSIAERLGGILPVRKADTGAMWQIGSSVVGRRSKERKPKKKRLYGKRKPKYLNMLPPENDING